MCHCVSFSLSTHILVCWPMQCTGRPLAGLVVICKDRLNGEGYSHQGTVRVTITVYMCHRRMVRGGRLIVKAGMVWMEWNGIKHGNHVFDSIPLILFQPLLSSHYYEPSSPIQVHVVCECVCLHGCVYNNCFALSRQWVSPKNYTAPGETVPTAPNISNLACVVLRDMLYCITRLSFFYCYFMLFTVFPLAMRW